MNPKWGDVSFGFPTFSKISVPLPPLNVDPQTTPEMAKKRKKPRWPHPHVTTMTACSNGQWGKKHAGKRYYFGTWDEPDAALKRWQREWPIILSGVKPRIVTRASPAEITVREVARRWREWQLQRKDIADRTKDNYERSSLMLDAAIGGMLVSALRPADFTAALRAVSEQWGIYRWSQWVVDVRALFNWAKDEGLIANVPRYGRGFVTAKRSAIREHQQNTKGRDVASDDAIWLQFVCPLPVRLCVLLGLSGGFGPVDCETLDWSHIAFADGVIRQLRHKTKAPRLVPLWPEVEAIMLAMNPRERGPVIGRKADWVSKQIRKHADSIGQWDVTLYDLRRTFATLVEQHGDKDAGGVIMGHVSRAMIDVYVQRHGLSRLFDVSAYVRQWLYTPTPRVEDRPHRDRSVWALPEDQDAGEDSPS